MGYHWSRVYACLTCCSSVTKHPLSTLSDWLVQSHKYPTIKDFEGWFNKLINIRTDLTSFGYSAHRPSSISCKCSCWLFVTYCTVFLYVSVCTGYWCWINILSAHSLCILNLDDTTLANTRKILKSPFLHIWNASFIFPFFHSVFTTNFFKCN